MAGLNLVPNSGQSLDETRDDIKNNFIYINTGFAVDHVELNSGANSGKHKAVTMVNQTVAPAAPVTLAGESAIYAAPSLVAPNASAIFIKHGASSAAVDGIEITYALQAASGWTQLPSGIIMQWGTTNVTNGATARPFPRAFPTACLNIQVTELIPTVGSIVHNWVSVVTGSLTTTTFTPQARDGNGSLATANIWFFAIGY